MPKFIASPGAPAAAPPTRLVPRSANAPVTALDKAIQVARGQKGQVISRWKIRPMTTWDEVEKVGSLVVPPTMRVLPISYINVLTACDMWIAGTEERIASAMRQAQADNAAVAKPAWSDGQLLPFNLPPPLRPIPQQRKAYTQIVRELGLSDIANFQNPRSRAALLPLPAGNGKTAIAAMVIKHFQDNNYFHAGPSAPLNNIIYITPRRVKPNAIRFFTKAGVKDLHTRVIVTTYTELRSKRWRGFFSETEDVNPIDGTTFTTYKYNWPFPPDLVIVDESHTIKKPGVKTTKFVAALFGPKTRVLFMSATAAVTVNDLSMFAITSGKKWNGTAITKHNWKEVAWSIAQADPRKPNASGMKRASEFFGDAIVKPPADPRKVKCFNSVKLLQFKTAEDREKYNNAEQEWLEKCRRYGKEPSEKGRIMAATQIFAAKEELLKAPYFVEMAMEELAKGRAPVIGVRFIDTVKEVYGLLMKCNHPVTGQPLTRRNISVIWGGEKIIQPHEVFTPQQFSSLLLKISQLPNGEKDLEPSERAKFRKSKKFHEDRWKREGETPAMQAERVRWLKETRLDSQGQAEQQAEMDAFQAGETDICVFTLSAGGTGVDLDHQNENAKPRTLISTICYYLEQFIQACGRCYRISTISDTYQYIIFFEGTLVADHTAPKLQKKIASTNAFSATGVNLEDDLINAVIEGKIAKEAIVATPVEQEDALGDDEDDEDEEEE